MINNSARQKKVRNIHKSETGVTHDTLQLISERDKALHAYRKHQIIDNSFKKTYKYK